MAVTKTTYTQSGSTTQYAIPFEVIDAADIDVYIEGVLQLQQNTTSTAAADHPQVVSGEITQGTALINYTVASNNGTITFNEAPTVGAFLVIERTTDDTLLETFVSGSTIRAQDLNNAFERVLFIAQEGVNIADGALGPAEDEDNAFDANGDRISNVGDATDDDDAVNRGQLGKVITDDLIAGEGIDLTDAAGGTNSGQQVTISAELSTASNPGVVQVNATTPITATYSNPGELELSIADGAIDIAKIDPNDIITAAEQDAGTAVANTSLFTSSAAARRFDTIVSQAEQSTAVNWEVGKTWLQNDAEKTVRIWDGSAWVAVASGGAFTTLPKVVYVDAVNGDDTLEGHRISNPKRTIKAAIEQINAETDEVGDGSVVIVAPGVYQETAPIDIEKKNVSIIGQALRSCIVHPTSATEENTLFRLNSGSYIANLTLTGVKASGTRGGNALDTNATYGLPTNQGWNFAFYPGATIVKSPYIANCTNFSDSEIDNDDLNAFNPRGGLGGDTDSAPTGGGILIDGSVVDSSSPLRSMVCDSYTHVGLDGPGIFVTNNGYCQATSSYAFFTHYHIKALNGGQANLAASTSDFGRFGLIAEGRSSSAIFTASTTATASSGATTFTIGAPTAAGSWHGSATRPQANMVVDIGGNTYSIISATANGSGWDVEISRPNPDNLSDNLGLNGSVASGSTAQFFLRSMIASSGHTMEYVGSGTNYSALPENGGVPVEANEIVELNDGKVWAATTNHQGKFTVGPTFNVDQVTGYVNIANGAIGIEQLIENLDLNSFTLSDSTGDVTIDDQMDMNTHKIVNVVDPTSAQDAATKNYVDTSSANTNYVAVTGDTMSGDLNMGSNSITNAAGLTMTGDITMNAQSDVKFADSDSSNWVAVQAPATIGTNYTLTLPNSVGNAGEALITDAGGNLSWSSNIATVVDQIIEGNTKVEAVDTGTDGEIQFTTDGTRAMTIDNSQNVGVGTTSPAEKLQVGSGGSGAQWLRVFGSKSNIYIGQTNGNIFGFGNGNGQFVYATTAEPFGIGTSGAQPVVLGTNATERLRIDSSGRVGIGTSSPSNTLHVVGAAATIGRFAFSSNITSSNNGGAHLRIQNTDSTSGNQSGIFFANSNDYGAAGVITYHTPSTNAGQLALGTRSASGYVEAIRIDSSQRVGIGTTSPGSPLDVFGGAIRSTDSAGNARSRIEVFTNGQSNNQITLGQGFGAPTDNIGYLYNRANAALVFGTNDTERLRITSDGKVGIGTSSIGYPLTVNGRISYLGAIGEGADTTLSSSSTTLIVGDSATWQNLALKTNGDNRLYINSSGNVGIGVTTVDEKLHVDGNIKVEWGSNRVAAVYDDSYRHGMAFDASNRQLKIFSTTSDSGGNISFLTRNGAGASDTDYGTERARIDSSGRLLVGTSSSRSNVPGADVGVLIEGASGGSTNKRFVQHIFGSADGSGPYLGLGKHRGTSTGGNTIVVNGDELGGIYFQGGDGSNFRQGASILSFVDGTPGANDMPGRLVFSTTADGAAAPTERMRIDSSGNVGIGTTSPVSGKKLTVAGDNATGVRVDGSTQGGAIEFSNNGTLTSAVGNIGNILGNSDNGLILYSGTGNTTRFVEGANERMRIDSSGRLLVNTSTARTNFYGSGTNYAQVLNEGTSYASSTIASVSNSSGYGSYLVLGRSRGTSVGSNTIVQSGDAFGIIDFLGADGSRLIQGARIYAEVDGTPGSNNMPGRLVFGTTADGASSPTERMRITRNGNVFINSTSNPALGTEMFGVAAQASGQTTAAGFANTVNTAPTVFVSNSSDTTNTYLMRFASGSGGATRGEIYYNGSQLVYATSSDYRLKENVTDFDDGITIVKQLRPVRYNWIESGNEDIGFIAHEVQTVFPNAVGGEKDEVDENGGILPQTYDPSKLVPLLTAALQEAIAKIETLEAKVAALEAN